MVKVSALVVDAGVTTRRFELIHGHCSATPVVCDDNHYLFEEPDEG
jgi:hypothetical protein